MGRGFGGCVKDHACEEIVVNTCATWSATATPIDRDRARNSKNTWKGEECVRVCFGVGEGGGGRGLDVTV